MTADKLGLPTIIVPYPGPSSEWGVQDIFVYLRPETNGVLVESTMLKVIKSAEEYSSAMKLVYMANFPGEFILKNNIIEQYYALKLHFAVMGRRAFTPSMINRFNRYFHKDFQDCEVLGAFNAIHHLHMEPEELFHTWVAEEDIAVIEGQTVKKIDDIFVVNYDIPALLHKNNKETDIAVMVFRTKLGYSHVRGLVRTMHRALVDGGIINPKFDPSRAFHYSKGPFEQIMDGIGYLFTQNREKIGIEDFTFGNYLINRGIDRDLICGSLMNPVVGIEDDDGKIREVNLLQHTSGMDYSEAYSALKRVRYQTIFIHHGPLLQSICPCFDDR
ncbi:hypothetical protein [Salinispira pacifica]|uniref:hypothetical protein n=1 Tax=Salinispira pacifica TaxID=1307761 RepID=UPI0006A6D9C5|nr:hypothetical protein [Salinispira pacifica]